MHVDQEAGRSVTGAVPQGVPPSVLIVGASLAGLRTAQALRVRGYAGAITMVGDERHLPYDRPPLSKGALAATGPLLDTALISQAELADLKLDLRLGVAASGLDLERRAVTLADGSRISYEALVIATGARPRRLTVLDEAGTEPVYLRTLDDAHGLRHRLDSSRRVLIVGAGFIGGEVASAARARGLEVTVVAASASPLFAALGPEVGAAAAALWRRNGVDLRCSTTITTAAQGSAETHVSLSDGSDVTADVVVVGIGATPCIEWLTDSGLVLDGGLLCDGYCRAVGTTDIYAAGDVARWVHPNYGAIRIEHWTNAAEQGDAVARTIVGEASEPFRPLPYFWSDQFGTRIQFVGRTAAGETLSVIDGSLAEGVFAGLYSRDGVETGCVAFKRPRILALQRRALASALAADRREVVAL